MRAVIIPSVSEHGGAVASYQFVYGGEDRELPDGGQKMRWRTPINDREVREFPTLQLALDGFFPRVLQIDEIAEEAFIDACKKHKEFFHQMVNRLAR